MLVSLHIEDFALFETLNLDFRPGLTVLTGETGAGKSILIDAIGAVLGDRTGSEVVRHGSDRAFVEAVFDVRDCEGVRTRLREEGYGTDGGELLLSREISRSGQGAVRINGRRTTLGLLREVAGGLVNLHGQHEHQSLLAPDHHLDVLDAWGGAATLDARQGAAAAYRRWKALDAELAALRMDERERARLADLYAFQVQEIESARLQPGEEEELLRERTRLAGAGKLAAALAEARESLDGESLGAVERLAAALARLREAARIDPVHEPVVEAVETALFAIQEAARDVASAADAIESNPARLEEIEERLDLLRRLKRKYGDTLDEVVAYRERTAAALAALQEADTRSAALEADIASAQAELQEVCGALRSARHQAAASLAAAMERELADLAMEKTRFEVLLEPTGPGPQGADRVEFLISPNPGEPLKPLSRIASGGELSRLMLALKSVIANADQVPTLIFDEIDVGVSGRVAGVIGRKLQALGRDCQVLCVTHLPQIAAAANRHLLIRKEVAASRTVTRVEPLDGEGRVAEIARIVAGAHPTATALSHAVALMDEFGTR